jgi:carbonic anhydrase
MSISFANSPISRRNLLRRGAFTGLATALSPALLLGQEGTSECPRHCSENPPPETPAKALQALIKGNQRWATFTQCHPHEDRARRLSVVKGQSPFAAILSCSDSRVPPELAFDQGIGDLFVARVAGNCAGGTLTESLYYGTKEQYLGALILFVLGHSDCGAVKAAIASYPEEDTFDFAKLIYPAVKAAINLGGNPDDPKTFIPLVTEQNVILGVQLLKGDSDLEGLLITGGVYDLATSQVNIPEALASW